MRRLIPLSFILLTMGFSQMAAATLGEKEVSVENVRKAFSGVKSSQSRKQYTLHTVTAKGIKINEYAATDGTIFAVTWHGQATPDLSTLLGKYQEEYSGAISASPTSKGRAPTKLKTTNLVIKRSGHMRNIIRQAYLSNLVPTGVDAEKVIQ